MTIISLAGILWAAGAARGRSQEVEAPQPTRDTETPKFVPVGQQRPTQRVTPAGYTEPLVQPQPKKVVDGLPLQPFRPGQGDYVADLNLRTELPGPLRQFRRESEGDFYERIRQNAKRNPGSNPAIFPTDEPIISKQTFVTPSYPRFDPATNQPYMNHEKHVEPCYVIYRRLLFEQPNFERAGYDFGVAQPFIHLGVFYYDVALAPYHFWTNPNDRFDSSIGKCLPGDPAPFTIPCEKFSVTGLVGQAGTILGLSYLFP